MSQSRQRTHVMCGIYMDDAEQLRLDQYIDWDLVKVMTFRDSMNGAHVLYVFERDVPALKHDRKVPGAVVMDS